MPRRNHKQRPPSKRAIQARRRRDEQPESPVNLYGFLKDTARLAKVKCDLCGEQVEPEVSRPVLVLCNACRGNLTNNQKGA